MNELIEKFKPVGYLHPKERYLPVSIEFYCKNSKLYKGSPTEQKMVLSDVSSPNLLSDFSDPSYNLVINDGVERENDSLFYIPYYCHYAEFDSYIDLQYVFLYTRNGPYDICGLQCVQIGEHPYDLEHVTIRLDKATKELKKVHFGAHQGKDGVWKDAKDVQLFDLTHVKVFIAKGSHATYPDSGCWCRIFCTANDCTSSDGLVWYPAIETPVINDAVWNLWSGSFSDSDTPKRHEWYDKEVETSTNCFKRLCCPCLN